MLTVSWIAIHPCTDENSSWKTLKSWHWKNISCLLSSPIGSARIWKKGPKEKTPQQRGNNTTATITVSYWDGGGHHKKHFGNFFPNWKTSNIHSFTQAIFTLLDEVLILWLWLSSLPCCQDHNITFLLIYLGKAFLHTISNELFTHVSQHSLLAYEGVLWYEGG